MIENDSIKKAKLTKLGAIKRKAVNIAETGLIKTECFAIDETLPLVITPAHEGVDLVAWATDQQEFLHEKLLKHGGILLRNFSIATISVFEQFMDAISSEVLQYRERSSPRSHVSGHIYTSTDYPPELPIFLHNELSYSHSWPLKIFFHCVTAAKQGGETPIADCRKIFADIDPAIRERFLQKGVMYIRNIGDGMGLPWQVVFQTDDKEQVAAYCQQVGMELEWKGKDRLRTRKIGRAAVPHPLTDEMIWFNHATFFHISTLAPALQEELLRDFSTQDVPTNTYYGDGSPIEPEVLDELRKVYHRHTVTFSWQEGDILLLDNMLVAHARAPFVGPRKVVVGMAQPITES